MARRASAPPAALKRPVGRPTKYDPAFCEEIVEVCAEGHSITGFAGKIGVDRDTITEWAKVYQEFSVALKRAKAAATYGIEKDANGIRKRGGGPGAATMAIFQLKNFAEHEYTEKSETKLTGDPDHPVAIRAIERIIVDPNPPDSDS